MKPTFFDHVAFHEDKTKYYYKKAHLGSVLITAEKKRKKILFLNLEMKTGFAMQKKPELPSEKQIFSAKLLTFQSRN